MNEADTRAELIDKQLDAAGWTSNTELGVRVRREYNINAGEIRASGVRTGQLTADYVLEYKGVKLAVVEAKRNTLDVSEGVAQAKIYAQKLRLHTGFAANGKEIYEINHKAKTEGKVDQFPSPEALWERAFGQSNDWFERFNAVLFEDMNGMKQARYYQELAVNRVMEAIAKDQQRVLLTLATGTGKTFIAFQIAWKLFKSRWTQQKDGKRQPRILFLTDRNILADQAYLDFGAFDAAAMARIRPNEIAKLGEVPKNASVFFTIFQTFMSGTSGTSSTQGKAYFGQYEKDFFDLVIIDECHRGGAKDESTWRGILDYFDSAVHLGLTATPKRTDNVDTYDYFGEPVFTYSLKEGIKDGFLTPFKVKRIQTTIDDYVYTVDDKIEEGEVERGHVYTELEFNKNIFIEARERKRVQEMLAAINPNEKTIVFCANQAHAAIVRDLINQEAKNFGVDYRVDYCVRVTSDDGAIGETYLKQFRDNDKSIPTILTTSQKLTTGVDARNVRNIVLMRPVNSMIEFKQIIGRGTRLFEGKHFFTIIDLVNAYFLFNDPEWDGDPVELEGGKKGEDGHREKPDVDGNDDDEDGIKKPMLRIKLSDGKERELQSMTSTCFFLDGKLISAEEYLKHLFDTLKLPELLGSEAQLRTLWANPVTRRELLEKIEAAGCHKEDLKKLQELINSQDSDLFDVLEYIAYAKPPITRAARVESNRDNICNLLNDKQREFIDYVLRNYVKEGVDVLDDRKISTTLTAKYGDLPAAEQALGKVKDIRDMFIKFQQELYADVG